MLLSDFDYHLPPELIAKYPLPDRDSSRLMVIDRNEGTISDTFFNGISRQFLPGDLLVLNDTRVIPARLSGRKETGGKVEIFLLRRLEGGGERWSCLAKGAKKLEKGSRILLDSDMEAIILEHPDPENWIIGFSGRIDFSEWLEERGQIPLPPYLQREEKECDRERYQTVYASEPGAVAAPTAGLHFSERLLASLPEIGVQAACLTLHTGIGTFMPVRVEKIEDHRIHPEKFILPPETAGKIRETRERGGRVIAVGTTVARTLEFCSAAGGVVNAGDGEADIFIYPGYRFRVVDALITNFHLPKSTLLMLVSAFAGKELSDRGYCHAIAAGYRFYSYGDAMFIV